MAEQVELKVLDLYLDTENPRHDPIQEKNKIIEYLIENEAVKNLAKDIAKNGLSPLDLFAFIRDENNHYIAVEGNRRLCALTLLNDPSAAPHNQLKYFTNLSENSDKYPKKVKGMLFSSREEADLWIDKRHSGEQDGVGTKSWDSIQKTRYNLRRNITDQNALAQGLIEYSVKEGYINREQSKGLITTAARYLGNPFFRKTMGIVSARSSHDIKICVPIDEFNRIVKRFCDDLLSPNSNVSSRSKKSDWENYARKLIHESVAPITHFSDKSFDLSEKGNVESFYSESEVLPAKVDHSNPSESKEDKRNNEGKNYNRGSQDPDKRKFIVSYDYNLKINNKILLRAFKEMKAISVDENPLAVSLLTRAFLENVYSIFHEVVGGKKIKDQTHIILGKVIKIIEADEELTKVQANALGALRRVQSNENNILSPKTLGAFAHAGHYPQPIDLKREFDNISAIVEYMVQRI